MKNVFVVTRYTRESYLGAVFKYEPVFFETVEAAYNFCKKSLCESDIPRKGDVPWIETILRKDKTIMFDRNYGKFEWFEIKQTEVHR